MIDLTTLHPVMRDAISPYLLPTAPRYRAPRAGRGQVVHEWHTDCSQPLVCHLDYSPPERGSREGGLQMEPDHPAGVELVAAYVRDIDILPLLSNQQRSQIEAAALDDLNQDQD